MGRSRCDRRKCKESGFQGKWSHYPTLARSHDSEVESDVSLSMGACNLITAQGEPGGQPHDEVKLNFQDKREAAVAGYSLSSRRHFSVLDRGNTIFIQP
ncbi:hypothetical protein HOLleu_33258 [Holothuria leucospilota]|uniref:Uncharacterized protein n=1 Tax=Holothuria leucospilota TaxID=206669 RepID=A0A9Q0YNC8_HOLLE|nr:hypothetical protein HOLleu_33258 [Holothuria leucospilota]